MSTQLAGVQYTIDAVVEQLSKNSTYKFSIVEVAFLYRWWNQANETQRQRMKTLYNNGQIEFLNGGWCMSDEAAPYYEDVIDQMTIGHRWLKETFGAIPTAAWHIDPFGHQSSSASMFSQMGMQAFFFARIDYQDKSKRLN
jgi:lysosomal alpha-mannosidase